MVVGSSSTRGRGGGSSSSSLVLAVETDTEEEEEGKTEQSKDTDGNTGTNETSADRGERVAGADVVAFPGAGLVSGAVNLERGDLVETFVVRGVRGEVVVGNELDVGTLQTPVSMRPKAAETSTGTNHVEGVEVTTTLAGSLDGHAVTLGEAKLAEVRSVVAELARV